LTDYLGGESVAAGKIQSVGTAYWSSPNPAATNESGFSVLPGGFRDYVGSFYGIRDAAFFWSATESEFNNSFAYGRGLRPLIVGYVIRSTFINYSIKSGGASVRCLKN
jgi:uncharacterized protein (TIGR02145 family)